MKFNVLDHSFNIRPRPNHRTTECFLSLSPYYIIKGLLTTVPFSQHTKSVFQQKIPRHTIPPFEEIKHASKLGSDLANVIEKVDNVREMDNTK
jgi:hypothetical protein